MNKGELIFEGNEKQVYATCDPDQVIFRYKDVATAFNNVKKAVLPRKGIVNSAISSLLFRYLGANGVETHFISELGEREQLCRKISIVPLAIIVRNIIAGSLSDRLGVDEGTVPRTVIYDLQYNNESLGDPLVNDTQAVALGLASFGDLDGMYATAHRIHDLLTELFDKAGLRLVDFRLEFGRASDGRLIVSDEISPDTSRIWDRETGEKLDRDRYRHDLGYIVASYEKVLTRLRALDIIRDIENKQ